MPIVSASSACLLAEVPKGDKNASTSRKALARQRTGELADIVDTHELVSPALALNDHALAIAGQLKVDAPVGGILAAGLSDLPPLPAEHFPDEPFELLRGEETEVGCPLDEITPSGRLDLHCA